MVWAAQIAGTSTDAGNAVATDSSGNVFVTGYYLAAVTLYNTGGGTGATLATAGGAGVFLAKYSSAGSVVWAAQIAGTGTNLGYGVATDSSGNVFVTGYYSAALTLYNTGGGTGASLGFTGGVDAFLAKYSSAGSVVWAAQIAGTTTSGDQGNAVATDSSGNVFVTGRYSAALTLYNTGGGTGATLAFTGGQDAFLAKYSSAGSVVWATRIASTGTDVGYGVATDSSGNVFVTGYYLGALTLYDTGGTTSNTLAYTGGGNDAFLAKYSSAGLITGTYNVYSGGYPASSNVLVDGTYAPSSFSPYVNGSNVTALSGTVAAATGLFIGGPSNYFNGSLSELLVYSATLTSTQRQSVEGYLAWKWGVKPSLPATHPFYSLPAFSRPFGPTDIPGCAVWLDGSDYSSFTFSSGSNISVWKDKSGTGNNFALNTGTTTNISDGGYSVVNFPSGAMMKSVNQVTLSNTSSVWIVAKVTINSGGLSDLFSFYNVGAGAGLGAFSTRYNNGILVGTQASTGDFNDTANAAYYVNGTFNPNFGSNYYYNTYAIIGTVSVAQSGSTYIMLSDDFYSRYFVGNIAEFIYYPGGVTSSQRQQIEGYLAAKWGLLNNLPGKTLSPLNIPGCALWLDAADTSTLTLSGNNVSQWRDKSGLGNNATAGGTGSPVLTQNAINGNQALYMNLNPYFRGPISLTGTTVTCFAVVLQTALPTDSRIITLGTSTSVDYDAGHAIALFTRQSTGNLETFRSGIIATVTATQNVGYLAESIYDGTNGYLYRNGTVAGSSASTGNFSVSLYGLGTRPDVSTTEFWQGYFGEFLIYTTALTTSQRQSVENYLMSKWGISNVTSHPFKSIPPSTSQPPQFQEVTPGNWTYDWQPYLQRLAAANSSGVTVTTSNITGGATFTSYGWVGGVLAPNGNIYFAPLVATNILVLNPTTGVTSNLTGGATYSANGWAGGVLAPNGNIYFCPHWATNILVLNPKTGVTSNLTGGATYPGGSSGAWFGGVLAPNGNIYFCPYNAANILVLNPTTGVTSNLTGGATYTAGGWGGGVLAPNGNIYFCPNSAANILVLNPTTGVTSNLTGGATYTAGGWGGGVLAPNGNIYFCPNSAANILVLNPTTGVTSNLTGGATYRTPNGWSGGGLLAPNGNIYFIPYSATNVLVLNPTTGVTSNLTGGATYPSAGSGAWYGGVLAPNGNIYAAPSFTTNILTVTLSGLSQTPSLSYCLSAWTNKY